MKVRNSKTINAAAGHMILQRAFDSTPTWTLRGGHTTATEAARCRSKKMHALQHVFNMSTLHFLEIDHGAIAPYGLPLPNARHKLSMYVTC